MFDLWVPCNVIARDGSKYFLTIVDSYTRVTWVYLLKNKTKALKSIQGLSNMIENQFECKIKIIRTDHGTEFHLKAFCHEKA